MTGQAVPRRATGQDRRGRSARERQHAIRAAVAVVAGRLAAVASRGLGLGDGTMIGGRVALAICPTILARLAATRTVTVVTGTNGKTTTSRLIAEALSDGGSPPAHNAAGSNMADGAVAALLAAPRARRAVLEVDELHLRAVVDAVDPEVLVLLNLSRDQLDRVREVRGVAAVIAALLRERPAMTLIANADDPLVVWAARDAAAVSWVAAGTFGRRDSSSCPACGHLIETRAEPRQSCWSCTSCDLRRPEPQWWWTGERRGWRVHEISREPVPIEIELPGRANRGNALMAVAAAGRIGVPISDAAARMATVREVAGRYSVGRCRGRTLRLLLVKNPAGWDAALDMMDDRRPVLIAINAREADGRDVSWLWDLDMSPLRGRPVVATGDRAADLGVRLSYAGIAHITVAMLTGAVDHASGDAVEVLANYTAFAELRGRISPTG